MLILNYYTSARVRVYVVPGRLCVYCYPGGISLGGLREYKYAESREPRARAFGKLRLIYWLRGDSVCLICHVYGETVYLVQLAECPRELCISLACNQNTLLIHRCGERPFLA